MARKQSREDQTKRIENFTCPIHGVSLTQIPFHAEGASFTVGACSRRDCDIRAVVDHEGESVGLRIRHLITPEQLRQLEKMWAEMYMNFMKQAGQKIDAEAARMARSPDVQLPVSG